MASAVLIVGTSNSGKTTFVEKLIRELTSRGRRVAAVKHNQRGFDIDKPGKDTWRMAEAGAVTVAMASPGQVAVIKKVEKEPALEEILSLVGEGHDLILVEGHKKGVAPKIEVFRKGVSRDLVCADDDSLVAVVTDVEEDFRVPKYGLEDVGGVADLLEERFIKEA
ncbi:MAG: molybdopterin-guanine dinucleotide biosynthesis protein B [Candidatus Aquicultorales bacterium]